MNLLICTIGSGDLDRARLAEPNERISMTGFTRYPVSRLDSACVRSGTLHSLCVVFMPPRGQKKNPKKVWLDKDETKKKSTN